MYKKKKKIEKRKIVVISLLVICLILGFIANIVKTDRSLTIFEKAIKDSVLTVEKIFSYPIDFIANKAMENNEKNKMYKEYENLKVELEGNKYLNIENEELQKQINELKGLLDLNTILSEYSYLNATVIGRDLGYWNDTMIIDKGENSGITLDMPVVVSDGLIGKVIKTTSFTSTVRLLTANNSNDKISIKIKTDDGYAYGILNGYDSETNIYTIEGISQNISVKSGAIVTTTGMGDIFPAGIVLGKITGVNTDNFDLANVLEMKSSIDFNNINYVKILKRNK